MARRRRRRIKPAPVDKEGAIVHGPQIADADGNIGSPFYVRDAVSVLLSSGRLDRLAADAANIFSQDFTAAHLAGVKAVDLLSSGGPASRGEPYRVLLARDRVMSAIKHLGGINSPLSAAAWHVIGLGETIKAFAEARSLSTGRRHSPQFASGLLVGACGALVGHYKL